MFNNLGYNKNLFILPFDHRSSFAKMFGFTNANLTLEGKNVIISAKKLIYQAFKKSVSESISKEQAAILIDEEYGDKIIRDAISQDYNVILTTEKSGQETFDFEYGKNFGEHIEKYKPTFTKALIRYKPNADWTTLRILSDYCHGHGYKFLLEMLIGLSVPNAQNLISAINELRDKGIEPDVWKLEGMENKNDYEYVVAKIQEGERQSVGLIILGRGENKKKVEQWIRLGRDVKGVIGFAVGRTVFSEPLVNFFDGKITREETINTIAKNYNHFYTIFTDTKREE